MSMVHIGLGQIMGEANRMTDMSREAESSGFSIAKLEQDRKRRAAAVPVGVENRGALDSGHRTNFESGAQRDRLPGKGRFVLLSPIGLKRIALRAEAGEIKYGDGRNWEKGMPVSQFIDSAMRHIAQYLEGDVQEDHLAAAAWNLQAAMHTEEKMPEMQDIPTRPEYKEVKSQHD